MPQLDLRPARWGRTARQRAMLPTPWADPTHDRQLSRWMRRRWPPNWGFPQPAATDWGCGCSSPSSPAPNCFAPCCPSGALPSTVHLTFSAQLNAGKGCGGGTPVTGIDGKVVTLTKNNDNPPTTSLGCQWKGDLVCGTGTPPAGNCGGGVSGCDGTNHFTFFCCVAPNCPTTRIGLLWTAAYSTNGNSVLGNHYLISVILTGTCSPLNLTGTTVATAPEQFCDTCIHVGVPGAQWNVTISA